MKMFESMGNFFRGGKGNKGLEQTKPGKLEPQEVNPELDYIQEDFQSMVKRERYERDILSNLLTYLYKYFKSEKFKLNLDGEAPVPIFLDYVGQDDEFDASQRDRLFEELSLHSDRVENLNSVNDLVETLKDILKEKKFLLDPIDPSRKSSSDSQ